VSSSSQDLGVSSRTTRVQLPPRIPPMSAGAMVLCLRSASGEAMITAPTGRMVRSFSANERGVRLPPLRRNFWNVRCAVGATPVSRTGCPPGPGSTPMRSANRCRLTAGQPAYGFVQPPRPGSGRRATVIGTSECRCDSGHLFTSPTPLFRGPGHDSAKIVGRGSNPLSGTSCVEVWVTELDSKSG